MAAIKLIMEKYEESSKIASSICAKERSRLLSSIAVLMSNEN